MNIIYYAMKDFGSTMLNITFVSPINKDNKIHIDINKVQDDLIAEKGWKVTTRELRKVDINGQQCEFGKLVREDGAIVFLLVSHYDDITFYGILSTDKPFSSERFANELIDIAKSLKKEKPADS